MTVVRVRGFQIFKDRHGRLRCYHRKLRVTVDLKKTPIGVRQNSLQNVRRSQRLPTRRLRRTSPGRSGC